MAKHGPYFSEKAAKEDAAGYRALGLKATVHREKNLSTGQRIYCMYTYRK